MIKEELKVKIVILCHLVQVAKDLSLSLKGLSKGDSDRFKVIPCTSTIQLLKIASEQKDIDLIIADESLVNDSFDSWVKRTLSALRMNQEAVNLPPLMLMLEVEKNPKYIREALGAGFSEVGVKPYDMSLMLEKINRLLPDKQILRENQVYAMPCMEDVNVAETMLLESCSESEAVLLTNRDFSVGEITSFYSCPFLETEKEIVAVCTGSLLIDHPKFPYRVTFRLQGLTPELTTRIRKWIKSSSLNKNIPFKA